jgi:dGTPase
VVTALERRYIGFDGLNLSWETLEGLVKHNGPLMLRDGSPTSRYRERGIPHAIELYSRYQDLELSTFASAEAQVAAIADDIAYDTHDIDDGLRAEFFTIADLADLPLIRELFAGTRARHGGSDNARLVHELGRGLITRMIEDVIAESNSRLRAQSARSVHAVRHAKEAVIAFSPAMAAADQAIKGFLHPHMYRHPHIMGIMHDAERVIVDIFMRYTHDPASVPAGSHGGGDSDAVSRSRGLADFIAGMTDRYALAEHARLFDSTPELR